MAEFLAEKRAGKRDMLSKTVAAQQQNGIPYDMAERASFAQDRRRAIVLNSLSPRVPPPMRAFLRTAVLLCCLGPALPSTSSGQGAYPSRPIKFVAPFPPGGSSDVLCRLLGAKLAEGLGQPVAVENRPGAAASIGHEYALKQPPDGYTIVITSSSTLVNNLYLYKHHAFDVFADFSPVSMIASAGQVLVVHPSVPAKSVKEL